MNLPAAQLQPEPVTPTMMRFEGHVIHAILEPEVQENAMHYYAPLVQFLQQAMRDGILTTMPDPMFYALTIEVAISLAKKQHAGVFVLDDGLIELATDACWSAVKE